MNGARVSLTDEDVAHWVISTAEAAALQGNWHLHRVGVIASAVAIGRAIGKREGLEPLDDGLRTVIEGALEIVRKRDPGMVGLVHNLQRLNDWLQQYPARGIPDGSRCTEPPV